ncbi:hypothetical protein PF010_g10084 [Phytophthora fragariae]|uniref:Uncharacterized protein n=1 Tax=Phytophthora fragariae TaxID=53985 RepID=A0A6G0LAD7_9STRA|nr:hypothetical protein PF010_g10084 [Phytophthora fragariae]
MNTDEFLVLATDHKQAIRESTHSFPIPRSKQTAELWAASFYSGRENRSSHAREKFRAWEDRVFELIRWTGAVIRIYCWIPCSCVFLSSLKRRPGSRDASAWRNHYRMNPGSHPALKIRRLRLKFTPSDPPAQ